MSTPTILVTGATGNIGQEVVRLLLSADCSIRVGVRNPQTVAQHFPENVTSAALDFTKPATFATAVQGCNVLFLLRPPSVANTKTTLNVLIDRAVEANVEHIVFVSVSGADQNKWVPHHAVEQHLLQGRVAYTILRPGFFCQNLETAYRDDILHNDQIYLPAGRGRVAFIDTRDIASVAVICMLSPRHRNQAYLLTGQETVTFDDVAVMLTDELKRTIVYKPASIVGYLWHLWKQNVRGVQAIVYTILHTGLRRGDAQQIDPTICSILDRKPRTMQQYIHDYRKLWEK